MPENDVGPVLGTCTEQESNCVLRIRCFGKEAKASVLVCSKVFEGIRRCSTVLQPLRHLASHVWLMLRLPKYAVRVLAGIVLGEIMGPATFAGHESAGMSVALILTRTVQGAGPS